MPSATQLLKKDHRTVEELFEHFEQRPSYELALKICQELEVHTQVEEEIVYPELRRVDEDLFRDATEEHEEVDELIQQVKQSSPNQLDRVQDLISEIKQKVEHHVEDEEEEDLPAMETACGEDVMERLGEQIEEWKQNHGSGEADTREELLDLTKEELYQRAKKAGIEGRSHMSKEELARELSAG